MEDLLRMKVGMEEAIMGKRKRMPGISLAIMLALSGCATKEANTEKNKEVSKELTTIPEQTNDSKQEVEQDPTTVVEAPSNFITAEDLATADYWGLSKENALAAVMKKAQAGEKVTICVLGGSITQGTISSGSSDSKVEKKTAYANIFFDWWEETFPSVEFEFINAGIGATDSYLGVHRVQKDVLDYHPDLVLVEYAVNDGSSYFYEKTYDNLLRKILLSKDHPAVLLLFMGQTNGTTAQINQSKIGYNYSLPMVSYINVINDMMEKGTYKEKDLSGDQVHPSALGHAITGEILWKYLNSVYEVVDSYEEPELFDKSAVTTEVYMEAQILDSSNIEPDTLGNFVESKVFETYPNNWTCKEGDGEITFTTTLKNLGIMYYCQTDGNGGQFEVFVDDEKVMTLDADFSNGWGNYAKTTECYTSELSAEHKIVIKKAPDSTGDIFTILGLLVSSSSINKQ